jgi:hypothetical protein
MGHLGCLGLASPSTAVLAARGEIFISRMKTPGLIHRAAIGSADTLSKTRSS